MTNKRINRRALHVTFHGHLHALQAQNCSEGIACKTRRILRRIAGIIVDKLNVLY